MWSTTNRPPKMELFKSQKHSGVILMRLCINCHASTSVVGSCSLPKNMLVTMCLSLLRPKHFDVTAMWCLPSCEFSFMFGLWFPPIFLHEVRQCSTLNVLARGVLICFCIVHHDTNDTWHHSPCRVERLNLYRLASLPTAIWRRYPYIICRSVTFDTITNFLSPKVIF